MAETGTARNKTAWFGWVTFAAVLLIVIGLLNILEGLVALLQRQVTFIDGGSLVVVNLTGLGIVWLIFGVLLLTAGIGLIARNTIARVVAITIVAVHALAQIGSLGAYPVWSLLMITLDVIILFALTVHWEDAHGELEAQSPGGSHRADRDQQRGGTFPVNAPTSSSAHTGPAHATPQTQPPAHAAPDSQSRAPDSQSRQQPGGQAPGAQQASAQPPYHSPLSGYQRPYPPPRSTPPSGH